MKKIYYSLLLGALAVFPAITYAQNLRNVKRLIEAIGSIVKLATPVLVGIALLVFFWGLIKFIASADNEDGRKQGIQIMIWGAVSIFVILSIFGIVNFIGEALDIGQGEDIVVPVVPGL